VTRHAIQSGTCGTTDRELDHGKDLEQPVKAGDASPAAPQPPERCTGRPTAGSGRSASWLCPITTAHRTCRSNVQLSLRTQATSFIRAHGGCAEGPEFFYDQYVSHARERRHARESHALPRPCGLVNMLSCRIAAVACPHAYLCVGLHAASPRGDWLLGITIRVRDTPNAESEMVTATGRLQVSERRLASSGPLCADLHVQRLILGLRRTIKCGSPNRLLCPPGH
jgi:hypothetical protein